MGSVDPFSIFSPSGIFAVGHSIAQFLPSRFFGVDSMPSGDLHSELFTVIPCNNHGKKDS
jgi:hypothetical protein